MLRMNLGLWPDSAESFHLLQLDTNTMSTTCWFHYQCSPESKLANHERQQLIMSALRGELDYLSKPPLT